MQAFEIRFHSALVDLIKVERNREAKYLAEGRAKDFSDYQKRVGILEGLERARKIADQLTEEATGARDAGEEMQAGEEVA
jgi:hypothetical protein